MADRMGGISDVRILAARANSLAGSLARDGGKFTVNENSEAASA
jgi:hypothetical protein